MVTICLAPKFEFGDKVSAGWLGGNKMELTCTSLHKCAVLWRVVYCPTTERPLKLFCDERGISSQLWILSRRDRNLELLKKSLVPLVCIVLTKK